MWDSKMQACFRMLQNAVLMNGVSYAGKDLRKLCTDGCLHIFILIEAFPALPAFLAVFDQSL